MGKRITDPRTQKAVKPAVYCPNLASSSLTSKSTTGGAMCTNLIQSFLLHPVETALQLCLIQNHEGVLMRPNSVTGLETQPPIGCVTTATESMATVNEDKILMTASATHGSESTKPWKLPKDLPQIGIVKTVRTTLFHQ